MSVIRCRSFVKVERVLPSLAVLGPAPTDFNRLISPQNPEDQQRAARLQQEYKLDPKIMKEVDEHYGPLEWRLPDAHAV